MPWPSASQPRPVIITLSSVCVCVVLNGVGWLNNWFSGWQGDTQHKQGCIDGMHTANLKNRVNPMSSFPYPLTPWANTCAYIHTCIQPHVHSSHTCTCTCTCMHKCIIVLLLCQHTILHQLFKHFDPQIGIPVWVGEEVVGSNHRLEGASHCFLGGGGVGRVGQVSLQRLA